MQFAATWMQREVIILSEVKTERERKNTIWYHHRLMDMNLDKFQKTWRTGEPGVLQSMESQRVGHNLVTEQQLMLNLKYDTSEPCLWNRKRITDIENTMVVAKGEGVGGEMEWKFGVTISKALYIEWINNNVLLKSTKHYGQYPMINHDRNSIWRKNVCISICITESLYSRN